MREKKISYIVDLGRFESGSDMSSVSVENDWLKSVHV